MIDTNNLNTNLTQEMRRTILQRAIYTQPYFYKTNIEVGVNSDPQLVFQSAIGINRDFYLTGYQTNFTETFNSIGTYDVNIYSGRDRSIYKYNSLRRIPAGFVFYDACNELVGHLVDRQHEKYPFLIRRNDKLFTEITALNSQMQDQSIEIVFKGFNILDSIQPLTPMQTDQCNRSLAEKVEWQFFKLDIDKPESKAYIIENDNKPRILLGFGAKNVITDRPFVRVGITDLSRRLVLTDSPIQLSFIAPRVPLIEDTHIYYLPIEYYLEPYAKLQFNIDYVVNNSFVPVEINMLTRTV